MKLTQEQISTVLAKLNEYKDNRRPCSICGNNEWVLSDILFEIREFNGGNLTIGGEAVLMPLMTVSCKRCGHTRFINAIKMGVVPPTPDENNKKE